jgi:hypothetical protein
LTKLISQLDAEVVAKPAFRKHILNDMIIERVIAKAAMPGRYDVSD